MGALIAYTVNSLQGPMYMALPNCVRRQAAQPKASQKQAPTQQRPQSRQRYKSRPRGVSSRKRRSLNGIEARQYQILLIKKAVGRKMPSLANSLNHSKLKKRITMMCNSKTSKLRRLRALAVVPALGVALSVVGDTLCITVILPSEPSLSTSN